MIKTALSSCMAIVASFTIAQSGGDIASATVSERVASSVNMNHKGTAIGPHASAAYTSVAIGKNAQATGSHAIAIGHDAQAHSDNTIILGGTTPENRVSVGIGTSNPSTLAAIELGDTDKGLLINRLTQEQANFLEMSLGVMEEGMMIYNIDQAKLQIWNGTRWINNGIQNVSLEDNTLQVDGREGIDLSKFADNTDQQNLTAATLSGQKLTIAIENGTPVTVDLSPLFAEYEARIRNLEAAAFSSTTTPIDGMLNERPVLNQNTPNPIDRTTTIGYYIPQKVGSAQLVITNGMGQVVAIRELTQFGVSGEERFDADGLPAGTYLYSLFVNNVKIDTKKLVID